MKQQTSSRTSFNYIFIFLFLAVVIILTAIFFYQYRKGKIKDEKYIELSAIGDLKVKQVISWRTEKLSDASVISRDEMLNEVIERFHKYRRTSDSLKIGKWMEAYERQMGYFTAYIYDMNLTRSVGDTNIFYVDKALFDKVLFMRKPMFSDLHYDNQQVYMDLYVPLVAGGQNFDESVGVLILKIDPDKYLYPIIQSWPTPSRTSEILIFKVENDSIVYLNKLRHIKNKPLFFKYPLLSEKLPAALAAHGVRGVVEGRDYRGENVLADLDEIPGSEWLVVTKVDLDEIFAPLYELYFNVTVFSIMLILAAAAVLVLMWRNQKAKLLYMSELDKQALIKNFEYLTKYANDVIFLFDSSGKIIYANERASNIYGYTTDDLTKMNLNELLADRNNPSTGGILGQIKESGGFVYEALHKKKDGSIFYIESSSRFIEAGENKYYQSIIRDVSEKKINDAELKKALKEKDILLKEIHHRVKNNLQLIISLLNLQANFIGDESIKRIFVDSQNRIKSMALLHEVLYKGNISSVSSEKYFNNLVPQLVNTYNVNQGRISVSTKIEDLMLKLDIVIPLGLIITEIISNIFKYAFPDNRNGNVVIEFRGVGEKQYKLIISDDGIGLPKDYDFRNSNTLGFQLIYSLSEQLDGFVNIVTGNGTKFDITLREIEP